METITTTTSFQFGINPTCLIQIYQHLFTSGRLECDNFSYVSIYSPVCTTGFTHIELSGNLEVLLSRANVSKKIQELKSFIKKNNLGLTVHAPTWAVELASPNESIRKASVETIINSVDLIKSLNSKALVLHLTGDFGSNFSKLKIPTSAKAPLLENYILESARKSLAEILDNVQVPAKFFAIENVDFPIDLTFDLAEEFNTSICLDTGHLAAFPAWHREPLDYVTCFERYYEKLAVVHLNDGGFFPDDHGNLVPMDHQALGEGKVPYQDIIQFLVANKFKRPIVFELPLNKGVQSLNLLVEQISKILVK